MTIAIILVSVASALGIDAVLERRPWVLVRDTGVYRYYEHPDGRRRAECVGLGHQPLDRQWLAGGEWTRPPTHLTWPVEKIDGVSVKTSEELDDLLRAREGEWVPVLFASGATAEALVRDCWLAEWRLGQRARLADLPARREGDPPASVVSWSHDAGETRPAPNQMRPYTYKG